MRFVVADDFNYRKCEWWIIKLNGFLVTYSFENGFRIDQNVFKGLNIF